MRKATIKYTAGKSDYKTLIHNLNYLFKAYDDTYLHNFRMIVHRHQCDSSKEDIWSMDLHVEELLQMPIKQIIRQIHKISSMISRFD